MNWINKILVANAAVLSLWAMSAQATTNEAIAERLKPVGEVCVTGQDCKGAGVAAAAAGAGAERSGSDIAAKHCNACHSIGLLGAPKNGETAAWKTRADKQGGLDGLLASAIKGLNAMPPKGTCADCSDAELKSAIKQLSGL